MNAVDREYAEGEVVRDQQKGIEPRHGVALIVLAAAVVAAPWLTAHFGFVAFVGDYALAALAWLLLRGAIAPRRAVIAIGIGLRVIFLFATPQLSGDVWRYLFDGRSLASGVNPYNALPDDPRVNHPEIPTIYPPHAEILFAVVHQLTAWRLLLLACDVAAMLLLGDGALALATFPPLLFEGAWSAHVEIVAALLLLVAWRRRSGAAFAAAVGMKVIPIAALPALFLRSTKRARFVLAFTFVLLAPVLPFVMTGPLMPGMRDYATRWVFNSPAYDAVFFAVDGLDAAPHLKKAFTAIKDTWHLEPIAHFVYYHLYADYLTRAALGCVALLLIVWWRRDPIASICALIVCSPAIHPWYWLVLAPLCFQAGLRATGDEERSRTAGVAIALQLCAPFSYLLYGGVPKLLVYALCYAPPLMLYLAASAFSDRDIRR